ncbi:unnamed protein product [Closterium sp. NIES-53]
MSALLSSCQFRCSLAIVTQQGDLTRPETLPAALVGGHTVIDCATGRPEEPIRTGNQFPSSAFFPSLPHQGDLTRPETLPAALVGVHTVIDCATGRPEEPIRTVDWDGKVALIQSAQAMGVQRYLFFSIHESEQHPEVPLMEIKKCTEKLLEQSTLNYTTIRLCGFMQVGNETCGC